MCLPCLSMTAGWLATKCRFPLVFVSRIFRRHRQKHLQGRAPWPEYRKGEQSIFVLIQRLLAFCSYGPVVLHAGCELSSPRDPLKKIPMSWKTTEILTVLFGLRSGCFWRTQHLIPTCRQAWEVFGMVCWEWKGDGTTFASDCFLVPTVLYDVASPAFYSIWAEIHS